LYCLLARIAISTKFIFVIRETRHQDWPITPQAVTKNRHMKQIQTIHPFPARMAPEIALEEIVQLAPHSLVLDPMTGSGTVLRVASENGHHAVGRDMDPLAVIMSRVWTTPISGKEIEAAAADMAARVRQTGDVVLPWIDDHAPTQRFVNFWFGERQQADLRRLSAELYQREDPVGDALKIAMSRLIISKKTGASLAHDVSHSRPHRVMTENNYDVIPHFLRSARQVAQKITAQPPAGNVEVSLGDARVLGSVVNDSVDAIVTSPPYLNAIDYIRGHKMTLVWLGYQEQEFRAVRTQSVGAERRPDDDADEAVAVRLTASMGNLDALPHRERRMVDRYALDIYAVMQEAYRVVKPGGKAVYVVGDSMLRDVFIKNSQAVQSAAEEVGFVLVKQRVRSLPKANRYLPPPRQGADPQSNSDLEKRMIRETILNFRKPLRQV
jgi:DNA modification methylase